jgi:hypothetical protein
MLSVQEGNPCAVPYNCIDWERRFEVAEKARGDGKWRGY